MTGRTRRWRFWLLVGGCGGSMLVLVNASGEPRPPADVDDAGVAADAGPDAAPDDPGLAEASGLPALRLAATGEASTESEEPAEVEPAEEEEEERFGSDKLLLWSPSGRRTASYPHATGVIRPDLEYYSYFAATNPEYERGNLMANVHLEQRIAISRRVAIDSRVRVVLDSNGEDPRFYSDFPHEGVYVTRLVGRVDLSPFELWAGKYEPAAGIYRQGAIFFGNYTRDLTLDGRIGGGASLSGGNDWIVHTLAAHLFRVDRSRLRGEILSDRWREDERLAGAGPFGFPKSRLFTLQGSTRGWENRLSYTLGLGKQHRGSLPEETIALAALRADLPIDGVGKLILTTDLMSLEGAGSYDETRRILGPGVGLATGWFYAGASYTLRRVSYPESGDRRFDHIGELVARYYISRRLTVEAAYQRLREHGETENALGAVIHYSADWLIH